MRARLTPLQPPQSRASVSGPGRPPRAHPVRVVPQACPTRPPSPLRSIGGRRVMGPCEKSQKSVSECCRRGRSTDDEDYAGEITCAHYRLCHRCLVYMFDIKKYYIG